MWLQIGSRGTVGIDSHHRYTEGDNLRNRRIKAGLAQERIVSSQKRLASRIRSPTEIVSWQAAFSDTLYSSNTKPSLRLLFDPLDVPPRQARINPFESEPWTSGRTRPRE